MNVGILRRWVQYLIVLLILAAACFVVGNTVAERSSVKAQAAGPAAPAGGANCTIVNLAMLDNRIHVLCAANTGGVGPTIVFFAAPTGSPAQDRQANRYMSLLTVAWAFGKHPTVYWADSSSLNPPSCAVSDCRLLTGVVLQ